MNCVAENHHVEVGTSNRLNEVYLMAVVIRLRVKPFFKRLTLVSELTYKNIDELERNNARRKDLIQVIGE